MTDLEKLKRASDYLSKGSPSRPNWVDIYSASKLLDEVIADWETAHERLYPKGWLRRHDKQDEPKEQKQP